MCLKKNQNAPGPSVLEMNSTDPLLHYYYITDHNQREYRLEKKYGRLCGPPFLEKKCRHRSSIIGRPAYYRTVARGNCVKSIHTSSRDNKRIKLEYTSIISIAPIEHISKQCTTSFGIDVRLFVFLRQGYITLIFRFATSSNFSFNSNFIPRLEFRWRTTRKPEKCCSCQQWSIEHTYFNRQHIRFHTVLILRAVKRGGYM